MVSVHSQANLLLTLLCVAEHGNSNASQAVLKRDEGWKDSYMNEDNYIVKETGKHARAAGSIKRGAKSAIEKLREACACCNKAGGNTTPVHHVLSCSSRYVHGRGNEPQLTNILAGRWPPARCRSLGGQQPHARHLC